MKMHSQTINIRKLSHEYTLTVQIIVCPEFRFRLWIARSLISLACRVLGCGLSISMYPDWKTVCDKTR